MLFQLKCSSPGRYVYIYILISGQTKGCTQIPYVRFPQVLNVLHSVVTNFPTVSCSTFALDKHSVSIEEITKFQVYIKS